MSEIIVNLDKIISKIDALTDTAKLAGGVKTACALVEREARIKAPKGTGELKRSIESKVEEKQGNVEGVVFTPLEYAPYVEYGTGLFAENGNGRKDVPWNYQDDEGKWHTTSGMDPRPYMRPALNDNRAKIITLIKGALFSD